MSFLSVGLADAAGVGESVYPPWQGGANNPAAEKGMEFTVPEADNLADFHGDLVDPRLVIYLGGNSFFTMAPLVEAFESRFPQYRGKIYFETLPPGILSKQLAAGGTITVGNMTWTVKPDVFFAGMNKLKEMVASGTLVEPVVPYVTNDLAIMVAKGNPKHIGGLADLARPDLRLAMPNIQFEGVARQIQQSLVKAGGDALKTAVYDAKSKDGSTLLTQIHHRQTPLYILQGKVDAGVTWRSEVLFQEQAGHPIAAVDIPAGQNTIAIYAGASVKGAAHPQAARDWLAFIVSDESMAIFKRYGFKPYAEPSVSK
ncbi:MAG: substrate-binding domain-containing protein [Burkholderiaceae bacterium]